MIKQNNKASLSAALRWDGLRAFNYPNQVAGAKSGFQIQTVENGLTVQYVGPAPNRSKMLAKYADVLTRKGAKVEIQGSNLFVAV